MFDIIVKEGTLPDGRVLDIGIQETVSYTHLTLPTNREV